MADVLSGSKRRRILELNLEKSRNYGALTDINTRPRTTYIANVINPNMEIGDRTGAPGKSYITHTPAAATPASTGGPTGAES